MRYDRKRPATLRFLLDGAHGMVLVAQRGRMRQRWEDNILHVSGCVSWRYLFRSRGNALQVDFLSLPDTSEGLDNNE